MSTAEIIQKEIKTSLPKVSSRLVRDSILLENPADIFEVAKFLKEKLKFNYLSSITAVDYLDFLESVYHFYSIEKKSSALVLRVRVKKDSSPIPSLVSLYKSAELQEREAFDTFGIEFSGHPDLRRLFMWEEFVGFPLRKDYIQEDTDVLEATDIDWLDKHNVKVPEQARAKAKELSSSGKRAISEKAIQPRV